MLNRVASRAKYNRWGPHAYHRQFNVKTIEGCGLAAPGRGCLPWGERDPRSHDRVLVMVLNNATETRMSTESWCRTTQQRQECLQIISRTSPYLAWLPYLTAVGRLKPGRGFLGPWRQTLCSALNTLAGAPARASIKRIVQSPKWLHGPLAISFPHATCGFAKPGH